MNRLKILKVTFEILPIIQSTICIIHMILWFSLDIDLRILSIIGGSSLITILSLWAASWCFRFCFYQKVFLYYLTAIQLINIIDEYYTLPISNYNYCLISYITFGITIIIYAILKFKENKRIHE